MKVKKTIFICTLVSVALFACYYYFCYGNIRVTFEDSTLIYQDNEYIYYPYFYSDSDSLEIISKEFDILIPIYMTAYCAPKKNNPDFIYYPRTEEVHFRKDINEFELIVTEYVNLKTDTESRIKIDNSFIVNLSDLSKVDPSEGIDEMDLNSYYLFYAITEYEYVYSSFYFLEYNNEYYFIFIYDYNSYIYKAPISFTQKLKEISLITTD